MGELKDALYPLEKNEKYGYIDKEGSWVVSPIYDLAFDFLVDANLAVVKLDNKMGYINREGIVEINVEFDDAHPFASDDLARVQIGDSWGCIDLSGKVVIDAKFDYIGLFSENGLALAEYNELSGYIDREGTWIIKPQFSRAWPFERKLARVVYKTGVGVIDKDMNWIIKPICEHIEFMHDLIYIEVSNASNTLVGYASLKGEFLTFNEKELIQFLPDTDTSFDLINS